MGIKGVVLENHGDVAILGGNVVHQDFIDSDFPVGQLFESGHHAKGGGLTATGRTDEDQEFLVLNLDIDVIDGNDIGALNLLDVLH